MYSQQAIRKIITEVHRKKISPKGALSRLKNLPYESFSFARVDHHRHFRKGFPEAIYAPGKTLHQLVKIIQAIQKAGERVLVTRLEASVWQELRKKIKGLNYSEDGRLAYGGSLPRVRSRTRVAIVTGGTSDMPVAEEAAVTFEMLGKTPRRDYPERQRSRCSRGC